MAPTTRANIYATPTHKRPPAKMHITTATKKSVSKMRSQKVADTVGVYLRLRPIKLDELTLIKLNDQQVKTVPPDGSPSQVYTFTQVFEDAPQAKIFDEVAKPVVEDFVKEAKDGLIFTYGITSSGKTYTMEGLKSNPGLIYRTIDFIFNSIGSQQTQRGLIESDGQNKYRLRHPEHLYPHLGRTEALAATPSVIKWKNRTKEMAFVGVDPNAYYCVFISLIELYNKRVHDLFEEADSLTDKEKKRREIRTDMSTGMSYVANAVEIEVKSADEAVEKYTLGVKRRKTGTTALNQESSRGHCVLNLKLVQVRKSYDNHFDEETLVSSQLCLVDLAGSERAKRSGATGGALHEACNINNSLGALRKCIRTLCDQEPTTNINYRECSLTRLFKSYLEGHGSVCMVLCVKPSPEDFMENIDAMKFGRLTQEVAIDYASPPKRTKQDYQDRKVSPYKIDPELNNAQFFRFAIDKIQRDIERRKKNRKIIQAAQAEFRRNLVTMENENMVCREKYERKERHLIDENKRLREENLKKADRYEQLLSCVADVAKSCDRMERPDLKKTILSLSAAPSAPEMEPLQSSSPVNILHGSTSETTESHTPPTTTNSSSEPMEYHEQPVSRSPTKTVLASPTSAGVPVINPRHNRSLSCSSMQWIHHRPLGTIDTGTVMKPKFKNGRSVRNLRSSDILRKDAAGYSVVHQDADPNGEVETSVYKGHIISTVCGGAQVILNDIETMKQVSPKRKRAASDAAYTH